MGHYPKLYASRPEQNDLDGCWLLQPVPPRMIAPELAVELRGTSCAQPWPTQLSLLPCLPCWTGLSRERDIKTRRLPPYVVDWVLPALLLPDRLIPSKWKARFLSFELPL